MRHATNLAVAVLLLSAPLARADTPSDFLRTFESEARAGGTAFSGFSARRGEQFFTTRQGGEWSCASCHTDDPAAVGTHAKTGRPIQALAPAANAERFTRAEKVEKWFRRNCNDVLGRSCTAAEKGDVLAYLITVRQ
jgi:mono/diheme cytochrome c family protein